MITFTVICAALAAMLMATSIFPERGTAGSDSVRRTLVVVAMTIMIIPFAGVTVYAVYRSSHLCIKHECGSWKAAYDRLARPSPYIDVMNRVVGDPRPFEWVPFDSLPPVARAFFTSIEDRHFFQRKGGIDLRGLARAAISDAVYLLSFRHAGIFEGASTIEEHVAWLLMPDRLSDKGGIKGKIAEMIAARDMSRELTKPQILEVYVNRVYLGRSAHGVAEAAQTYFGCDWRRLTLAGWALLVSAVAFPSAADPANPYRTPWDADDRRVRYLKIFATRNPEFADAAQRAMVASLPACTPEPPPAEREAILYARKYVSPSQNPGDSVLTTFDLDLIWNASAVVTQAANLIERGYAGGTFAWPTDTSRLRTTYIAVDLQTREMRAVLCSRADLPQPPSRRCDLRAFTDAVPPLSTIKPILYAAGITAGAFSRDATFTELDGKLGHPQSRDPWIRRQCARTFTTLRDGIKRSVNCSAIYMFLLLPGEAIRRLNDAGFALRPGIETDALGYEPVSLLALISIYAALLSDGCSTPILANPADARAASESRCHQPLFSAEAIAATHDAMQAVAEPGGTGQRARTYLEQPELKTGTSVGGSRWIVVGTSANDPTVSLFMATVTPERPILEFAGHPADAGDAAVDIWAHIAAQNITSLKSRNKTGEENR